ncbi:MAG: tetratricopeptide repeat protein [Terriglobia bacterium]
MRQSRLLALFLGGVVLLSLAGCSKLRARDELNRGVRAYKGGQYGNAIEHFQRAIELDPELLNARVYLATAYATQFVPGSPAEENQKLGEAAIREFEKVLEEDPGNVTALGYIASIYFGLAKPHQVTEAMPFLDKAKEFRQRLIEVEPQNPEHYYSIGVIDWNITYQRNQQLRTDLGRLQPDVRLPTRPRRSLAELNGELVEEGITMLERALEVDPGYLDAMSYLNLMYRQKADIVESIQEREDYIDRADELVERYLRLRKQHQKSETATAAIP